MRTTAAVALCAIWTAAGVRPAPGQKSPKPRVLVVRPDQLDPLCRVRVAVLRYDALQAAGHRRTEGLPQGQEKRWANAERRHPGLCLAPASTASYVVIWSVGTNEGTAQTTATGTLDAHGTARSVDTGEVSDVDIRGSYTVPIEVPTTVTRCDVAVIHVAPGGAAQTVFRVTHSRTWQHGGDNAWLGLFARDPIARSLSDALDFVLRDAGFKK